MKSPVHIVALVLGCVATAGCLGPEAMIAANVASAALKATVEYAERNRPSPQAQWRQERVSLLRASAERGELDAQVHLAKMFQASGDPAAYHWMCRAARAGSVEAQRQLGHWYSEDRLREDLWPFIGVTPDDRDAWVWYSRAAAEGDPLAIYLRDRTERQLAADELLQARARLEASASGCGAAPLRPTEPRERLLEG
ncbi:MAG: sel1 repeat family protein [Ectothiorhodospiraceae bacterium]|nr:sel1 repeat family protein [Chromatiales bacterium]MCP5156308.1 sel1 repeat family protein [Ectothiorhodospiraceae bacterium]